MSRQRAGGSGLTRLGPGALRAQVLAALQADPAASHTPGELAHRLGGRSSGAVGAALNTLVDRGQAIRASARPRRFRAAPARHAEGAGGPGPGTVAVGASRRRYHPRALAEGTDLDALQVLRRSELPALLYGPPGTGKTALAEAAFGQELVTVAGDEDTTVADLVGDYTQAEDGTYPWINGPLVVAMVHGKVLFLDDATLISPRVLAVVYPAMDGRRQVTLSAHKGETITAQPGFYVIAGHNPGVHGAVLTEALASRFAVHIQVSTDYDLALGLGVSPKAVRVARNLATKQQHGEVGWAPQLRELLAFQRLARVLGEDAAVANLLGLAPPEDLDVVARTVQTVFGRGAITPLALGRQV